MTPFHQQTHPLMSSKGNPSMSQPSDQPIVNGIAAPKTTQKVPSKHLTHLSDEVIKSEYDHIKATHLQPQAHHQMTQRPNPHRLVLKPKPGKPKSIAS